MRPAEAFELPEVGGDHFRSSAVFLTQAHPKQTQGSDVYAGTSFDQFYAKKFGQDTPLPSIQLSIESVDQAGGCEYGYCLRLHRHDQLGRPEQAAADGPRSAHGFRSVVRRRRQRRKSGPSDGRRIAACSTGVTRKRIGLKTTARTDRSHANWTSIWKTSAKSNGASRRIEAAERSGEVRHLPSAPDRRAGCVGRARETDVRSAGAGVRRRHHARVFIQDEPRRIRPRRSRKAASAPASMARRITAKTNSASLSSRQINKYHVSMVAVLPRETEEDCRKATARCWTHHGPDLRIADGQSPTCTTTNACRCFCAVMRAAH